MFGTCFGRTLLVEVQVRVVAGRGEALELIMQLEDDCSSGQCAKDVSTTVRTKISATVRRAHCRDY